MVKRATAPRRRAPKRRRFDGPIHARLADLRAARELSQAELAERLDVTSTLVSHWETGFARPGITLLPKLARALDTTVADLIRGEPEYVAIRAALGAV